MGQASHARHDGQQRTLTNGQVLALFDIAPIHIEIDVRRIRLIAGVVVDPGHHEVFCLGDVWRVC